MGLRRFNLTDRDRQIVETLALRVRVLTVEQIARTWFGSNGDPVREAGRRIRRLESHGLVERFTALARPELPLRAPLWSWTPGHAPPCCTALATQLARRWRAPLVATRLVVATKAAGVSIGGAGGRRPRASELSHDITLAAVYLNRLGRLAADGDNWISEARLPGLGYGDHACLPDAVVESHGRQAAVEVGGAYSARKLAKFHEFCEERRLPYELW